jgi:transposase
VAVDVLSHLDISDSTILADKAYGTSEILDYIQQQDSDYAIPPKSNARNPWWCDWVLYKEHHLVEYFFLKLRQFRRVATR